MIRRFALAACATVAALYLGELVLSFFVVKSLARNHVPPHAVQRHTTDAYDVTYRYNNLGLRGPDFDPAIEYDVALLGDSFLFGLGVEQVQTMQHHLERAGLKTLNLSEVSSGPTQYLHKLNLAYLLGLRTRCAVVGLYVGNDFEDLQGRGVDTALRYDYSSFETADTAAAFLRLSRVRFIASRLLARNEFVVHEYERAKHFDEDWIRWYTEGDAAFAERMRTGSFPTLSTEAAFLRQAEMTDESLQKVARIVNHLAEVAARNGTRVVLLIIPDLHFAKGELRQTYRKLLSDFRVRLSSRLAVLDLHGACVAADYIERDGHWNSSGHAKAARALVAFLDRGS